MEYHLDTQLGDEEEQPNQVSISMKCGTSIYDMS